MSSPKITKFIVVPFSEIILEKLPDKCFKIIITMFKQLKEDINTFRKNTTHILNELRKWIWSMNIEFNKEIEFLKKISWNYAEMKNLTKQINQSKMLNQ